MITDSIRFTNGTDPRSRQRQLQHYHFPIRLFLTGHRPLSKQPRAQSAPSPSSSHSPSRVHTVPTAGDRSRIARSLITFSFESLASHRVILLLYFLCIHISCFSRARHVSHVHSSALFRLCPTVPVHIYRVVRYVLYSLFISLSKLIFIISCNILLVIWSHGKSTIVLSLVEVKQVYLIYYISLGQ